MHTISETEVALSGGDNHDIWVYEIRNNELVNGERITKDGGRISVGVYEDAPALFFYEHIDRTYYEGTLTCYVDGDCIELAEDAYSAAIVDDSDMVVLRGAWDYRTFTCSLTVVKKGDDEEIAEDVWTYEITEDETIFYTSEDDLYYWNGKESVRIAKDVKRFWINNSAAYSEFRC